MAALNFYLIESAACGYDTYDSAIVAAKTLIDAKTIHPSGDESSWDSVMCGWGPRESVTAKLVGVATTRTKRGVVLSSYNAG
jgi:hypothetical protein